MKLRFQRGASDSLESLYPAYFALVMATGIVATAARIHGLPILPDLFFWFNSVFLAVLILLTLESPFIRDWPRGHWERTVCESQICDEQEK